MKCPNCKKELPDYAQACGHCGTKLEAKNTCPQCGKELPADALACGYCGARLGQPAAKAPKAAPAVRPAPVTARPSLLSGLPKWALPAGIVALVVVVILFFVLLPGPVAVSSPSAAANDSSAIPSGLSGSWNGIAVSEDGSVFEINITFNDNCEIDKTCGFYDIVNSEIHGDYAIVEIEGDTLFLESRNISEASSKANVETISLINSEEMEYYVQGDDFGTYQGMLYKE